MPCASWTSGTTPLDFRAIPCHTNSMKNNNASSTLFQTGNDLSEDLISVYRSLKSDTFDVYQMTEDTDVTIVHSCKRGPSELIESDPVKGDTYRAGVAYDVFNVWIQIQTAIPGKTPGLKKCIAEDVRSFDDAWQIASEYVQDMQFDENYILENDYDDNF